MFETSSVQTKTGTLFCSTSKSIHSSCFDDFGKRSFWQRCHTAKTFFAKREAIECFDSPALRFHFFFNFLWFLFVFFLFFLFLNEISGTKKEDAINLRSCKTLQVATGVVAVVAVVAVVVVVAVVAVVVVVEKKNRNIRAIGVAAMKNERPQVRGPGERPS